MATSQVCLYRASAGIKQFDQESTQSRMALPRSLMQPRACLLPSL